MRSVPEIDDVDHKLECHKALGCFDISQRNIAEIKFRAQFVDVKCYGDEGRSARIGVTPQSRHKAAECHILVFLRLEKRLAHALQMARETST